MQLWSLGRMSAGGMRYESLVHISKLSQLICCCMKSSLVQQEYLETQLAHLRFCKDG